MKTRAVETALLRNRGRCSILQYDPQLSSIAEIVIVSPPCLGRRRVRWRYCRCLSVVSGFDAEIDSLDSSPPVLCIRTHSRNTLNTLATEGILLINRRKMEIDRSSSMGRKMEIDRSSSMGMTMEEMKHYLLCTSLELENTKIAMEEELKKKDNQLLNLKGLLDIAIAERDEAQERCQTLLLQNIILHQQQQFIVTGASSAHEEDELGKRARKEDQIINGGSFYFSSSVDCEEESSAASATLDSMVPPNKPLPEKGKLLETVMRAGPLLQTLLLAGPLPQWIRPPPSIASSEIPPVKIPSPPPQPLQTVFGQESLINCSRACGKRGVPDGFFESPTTESKCQRPLLL